MDKRHSKAVRIGRHGGLQNPEADLNRRVAAVEERIKGKEALARKQERHMSKAMGGGGGRAPRNARLSENYLEEEQVGGGGAGGRGAGEEQVGEDGVCSQVQGLGHAAYCNNGIRCGRC